MCRLYLTRQVSQPCERGDLLAFLFRLRGTRTCHCEPVTDVTGVAIRSQSLQGQSAFFPVGEANLEPALSHLADIVSVRERRLACISFSLAGDAKKKSLYRPVFALVDESHLCGFRT